MMILNCGGNASLSVRWGWPSTKRLCLASSQLNTEQLRTQLDQLHSEAEHTRAKAKNARLRLMRLSEAAEKLRQQAAISIQTGRENDARELLFQKKKIMQALEKSKTRITLLDELSSKLNEAISVRETQLIENAASDLNISRENASSTVRIVSPKDEDAENFNEDKDLDQNAMESLEYQGLKAHTEVQAAPPIGSNADNLVGSLMGDIQSEADLVNSLKGISSYEDFLEHLDQQLNKIEAELITVLKVSTFVLEDKEKPKNSKVLQTMELLEGIVHIRKRISTIIRQKWGSDTASFDELNFPCDRGSQTKLLCFSPYLVVDSKNNWKMGWTKKNCFPCSFKG